MIRNFILKLLVQIFRWPQTSAPGAERQRRRRADPVREVHFPHYLYSSQSDAAKREDTLPEADSENDSVDEVGSSCETLPDVWADQTISLNDAVSMGLIKPKHSILGRLRKLRP